MSVDEVLEAAEPRTPLEWARWSRLIARQMELTAGEAHVLQILAGHADRRGRCYPSVDLIAREVRRSVSQVHRLLKALVKRGLVRSRQRGRYRSAERELVHAPVNRIGEQLSLFDQPQAAAAAAPRAASRRPGHGQEDTARRRVSDACSRTGASMPSHPCEPEGPLEEPHREGGRDARKRAVSPVCSSGVLGEVLEVLEAAPGVRVDVAAVNAVLCRFPDQIAADAARDVVMWATRGGLDVAAGSVLLHAALRKRSAAAPPAAAGRPRANRRPGRTSRGKKRAGRAHAPRAAAEVAQARQHAALAAVPF